MDGILVINKPSGMTSHDVISFLRRKYHMKKFGHTGTLDPQAEGVLVVLAGKYTRLLPYIEDTDKTYLAGMELGRATDTMDIWGETVEEREVVPFDFEQALESMKGPQKLRVPAASAKKVNGKKLMDYARKNQPVPEVWQDVMIYDIREKDRDNLLFEVDCSSGTYVRSIVDAIARKTGNLGAMKSLVRTRANGFTIDQAEELDGEHTLHSPFELLKGERITPENLDDIMNGRPIYLDTDQDQVLIDHDGSLMAVYRRDRGRRFTCARGFQHDR